MHSISTVVAIGIAAFWGFGHAAWAQPAPPEDILAVAEDATGSVEDATALATIYSATVLDRRLMRAAELIPSCTPKARVTPAILRELRANIAKYANSKPYLDLAPGDTAQCYCYFGLVLKELSSPPRKTQ